MVQQIGPWFQLSTSFYQILRSTRSRYIKIYEESGTQVISINAATSPAVTFPQGTLGRELTFRTLNFLFTEKRRYYVLLDPGECCMEMNSLRNAHWTLLWTRGLVLLLHTSSSLHWYLRASRQKKSYWIVATKKRTVKKSSCGIWSKKYGRCSICDDC